MSMVKLPKCLKSTYCKSVCHVLSSYKFHLFFPQWDQDCGRLPFKLLQVVLPKLEVPPGHFARLLVMGAYLGKSWSIRRSEMKVLMLGLDAAGKTTLLHQAGLADVMPTIPKIGFHFETGRSAGFFKVDMTFTVLDLGSEKMLELFRSHYQGVHGLIFVIDSHDRERIHDAAKELKRLLQETALENVPLLVAANKQDLPDVLTVNEIQEMLELSKLDRTWSIWPVAGSRDGFHEGLEWLAESLIS